MRISDWSSDVCSSDLTRAALVVGGARQGAAPHRQRARRRQPRRRPDPAPAHLRALGTGAARDDRSEERRVGKEWVSTCRYRWSPYHKKNNKREKTNKTSTQNHTKSTTINQKQT